MNKSFWIRSITVGGHDSKPDSTVTFTDGLNVIYGQSDAGKTWVLQSIDYMFGARAKDFEIKPRFGYAFVRMEVVSPRGTIELIRWIGDEQNTVKVASSDPRVGSGDYKVQSNSKTAAKLSDLWLRLIGYEHPGSMLLPKSNKMDPRSFTWRTFWHLFYANENRISDKKPIFTPDSTSSITPTRSALVSLLTGKDYSSAVQQETEEEKERANAAIIGYLEKLRSSLREQLGESKKFLEQFSQIEDVEQHADSLNTSIAQLEAQIRRLIAEGQSLGCNLTRIDERITEAEILRHKYEELRQSYQARIDRIDFTADGVELLQFYDVVEACPVCDQPLPEQLCQPTPEQDRSEKTELQTRLTDLLLTSQSVESELELLHDQREQLANNLNQINSQLAMDLNPELLQLKAAIQRAMEYSANHARTERLEEELENLERDLEKRQKLTFTNPKFKPLNDLEADFWSEFESKLFEILTACGYEGLTEIRINRIDFDAVVNRKDKASFGKGYRAFINTAMVLTLREYMAKRAVHNPGIILIDTPLLGLDDLKADESQELIDAIPLALYDYMAERQDYGQVIVADNTKFMPTIAEISQPCNLIEFTKRTDSGRFGFILNSTDEDFTDEEEADV